MKVLITGCNRTRKNLVSSLKNNRDNRRVEVIGINNNPENILRTEVDEHIIAPSIVEPHYIDWLLDLCDRKNVDVVFPFIQAELPIAAFNRKKLESKGSKISVTSVESLEIVNDKVEMARMFPEYMPRQAVVRSSAEIRSFARSMGYYTGIPLCCKILGKCGGLGFAILDEKRFLDISLVNRIGTNRYISIDHLCEIADKVDTEIILQEYVNGIDYSVCVLADHGRTIGICGYVGGNMEFGSVTNGEIFKNEKAYDIAKYVVEQTGLDGHACFDFILRPDGIPILLECNPRLNALISFVEAAGADFAYLRCKQLLNEPFDAKFNINYGLKMVKYYEYFFYK